MKGVNTKTTVLIQDELYAMLSSEAKEVYGSIRKRSEALNAILRQHFSKKKSLFGTTEPFGISGLRDKRDRF